MKLEMITHIATSEEMSLPTSRILPSRADHGTRTRNPRITSAVRYQLRQVGLLPEKFIGLRSFVLSRLQRDGLVYS